MCMQDSSATMSTEKEVQNIFDFDKIDDMFMQDSSALSTTEEEIKNRKTEAFGHLLAARATQGGRMTRKTKTLIDQAEDVRKSRGTRKTKGRYITTTR